MELNQSSGPVLQNHCPHPFNTSSEELGYGEPKCSGLECPLGFEGYSSVFRLSNRAQVQNMPMENFVGQNFLEKGNEANQSFGVSLCSFLILVKKVSQTPTLESVSFL